MSRFHVKPVWLPLLVAAAVVVQGFPGALGGVQSAPELQGFRGLSGIQARTFVLPNDVTHERTLLLRSGGTMERYQQYVGGAKVLGGQLTLYRDASGTVVNVIGAHYPAISSPRPVAPRAGLVAAPSGPPIQVAGHEAKTIVEPMIHPETGRRFVHRETQAFASRWVEWIDEATGVVVNRYNALEFDHGIGVKGDTKDMNGADDVATADDLTTFHNASSHTGTSARSPHWDLNSNDGTADGRYKTFDGLNCTSFICFLYDMVDTDNHWVLAGRTSPGQPAAVDAQYYASVVDRYYRDRHGLDWLACTGLPAMKMVVHWLADYNNAFWNGQYLVFGDGDGTATFRELSGGLDVVAHEGTHAVTGCTSGLQYQDAAGALNESISDIMAASVEFFAQAMLLEGPPSTSNCVLATGQTTCPDWLIGEDISLFGPSLRNMADPGEDDQPDHYSERYTGTEDNGGVHTNSGIPNHAYYLAVNGGQNAGCARGHNHGSDCSVSVNSIGLLKAEQVFFQGFSGLPTNATFSNARDATVARAESLYGPVEATSIACAWQAVGVTGIGACGAPSATDTPTATPSATATPTATNTPVATSTATATSTSTPTLSPTPTWTSSPTSTPTNTPTPTTTPTNTATPTATPTNTSTPTPVPSLPMHVGDLDGSTSGRPGGTWRATVNVTVHGTSENPVSSATVYGRWNDGQPVSVCTTGSNGRCKGSVGSLPSNSVKFEVTDVVRAGWIYPDPNRPNHDPDSDSTGTIIVLN